MSNQTAEAAKLAINHNGPKRTPPRLLQVVKTECISPHMQRITLSGDAIKDFPEDRNGAHIKVFLPLAHQDKPVLPTLGPKGIIWPPKEEKPITRTYSVRKYRREKEELEVDFVLHGHDSPASGWALKAKPGDFLGIAGPGGPDPLLAPADWHIIAGDMTALPAISALLEELPEYTSGHVFIEVTDESERQPLATRSVMEIHWLYRGNLTAGRSTLQLDAIKQVDKPENIEAVSAWVAGENNAVVNIRNYLKAKYGLTRKNLYAVPYWRDGFDEEGYHEDRHKVMDEEY
ncbi:siderophore-interacting protein [Spartinivicinus ruber]|uniref:siderophore-interacting protein n=1 Tax=Spartinivicinus ruber TaxID=2683272 RepID=UPI001E3ED874|nr:siderophore-interacting protein [Spartinivicinus ruber]